MKALLVVVLGALAIAGCHERPATVSPTGVIHTSAPPPDEDAEGQGTITATTAYAYAPEAKKLGPFDPRAAREAFARVDVRSCGASTDGHAKVTFGPEGTVTKIVVDYPFDLPLATSTCIARELAKVGVDAFDGAAVTLGTSWRAR